MEKRLILFDLLDIRELEFSYYQENIEERKVLFEYVFHINEGTIESKKSVFNNTISFLENLYENETLYLHFTGHVVVENKIEIIGLAFLMWYELEEALIRLKRRNNLIVLNLMNVCKSIAFQDFSGFDKLLCCINKTRDFISPFEFYEVKNFDFKEFQKRISKTISYECSENYREIIKEMPAHN